MNDELLARLERYYDEAPRANADTEEHGPFTIFVSRGGWPYYARPRLGLDGGVSASDVTAVLARLEELGVPKSIAARSPRSSASPFFRPTAGAASPAT